MYIPAAFREHDTTKLHDFIEQHSFGLLVSQSVAEPLASHLPLLLERQSGPHGTLVGHMARANPQWQEAQGKPVLAVFSGPHAYISPTWYQAEQVVPTWNYAAVHVYGTLDLVEEADRVYEIVRRYVDFYEHSQPQPWQLSARDAFLDKLLRQIVGFRIDISRIEGKWKLSQNHPQERRERVMQALAQRNDADAQAIAELMQNRR